MNEDLIQHVLKFVTNQTDDEIPNKNTMQIFDQITDNKIQKLTKKYYNSMSSNVVHR